MIFDVRNSHSWYKKYKTFSDIIQIPDMKKSFFWYHRIDFLISKMIFWYLKFKLISWYQKKYFLISGKTNHFWYEKFICWYQEFEFVISKIDFLISKNQNSWYQENKLFIAIKNINFDIHIINSKFFFNIRNWFLDIKIWILDIRKWFFDIKISIFWYLEFFFCIKNSNYWYQ